jgi:hypothetical protein
MEVYTAACDGTPLSIIIDTLTFPFVLLLRTVIMKQEQTSVTLFGGFSSEITGYLNNTMIVSSWD